MGFMAVFTHRRLLLTVASITVLSPLVLGGDEPTLSTPHREAVMKVFRPTTGVFTKVDGPTNPVYDVKIGDKTYSAYCKQSFMIGHTLLAIEKFRKEVLPKGLDNMMTGIMGKLDTVDKGAVTLETNVKAIKEIVGDQDSGLVANMTTCDEKATSLDKILTVLTGNQNPVEQLKDSLKQAVDTMSKFNTKDVARVTASIKDLERRLEEKKGKLKEESPWTLPSIINTILLAFISIIHLGLVCYMISSLKSSKPKPERRNPPRHRRAPYPPRRKNDHHYDAENPRPVRKHKHQQRR